MLADIREKLTVLY